MNKLRLLLWAPVLIIMFFLGRCTSEWGSAVDPAPSDNAPKTLWTCSMHAQVRLPDPGPCPICGMDLVLADQSGGRRLVMSEAARKLAGIVTERVSRRYLKMSIPMVGKVDFNETAVRSVTARVSGRLDRLFVDYTGVKVNKGDHLVWLYSPDLLVGQQELLEAKKLLTATAGEASEFLAKSNQQAYRLAREKLILWGLTEAQVDEIESRGEAQDHMMITSPVEGVVIHKHVNEGDYVSEGSKIYRIADLSHLWVQLDAYEQDLPWLRYGQTVTVQAEALPGEIFEGWIVFIDPVIQSRTRTARVRVDIDNSAGKLKPGMFVRASAHSRIAAEGKVLEPRLAGKWISPMHPEIIKDAPGQCDVCGMDLVPAAELGYAEEQNVTKPLVVPFSAVLVTGTRGVVYVEVPGEDRPTYEGRDVILGPRAGDYYIIRSGLSEGERVVVNGAFRIDSSMQIKAKPSMMSIAGEQDVFLGEDTLVFRRSLAPLYEAYLAMQSALVADQLAPARSSASMLSQALEAIDVNTLPRTARELWQDEVSNLGRAARRASEAGDLSEVRVQFELLSRGMISVERAFRHLDDSLRYEAFCPMAFDKRGATWLQIDREILNPYFGQSMLNCGEIREEFLAPSKDKGR